MRRAVLAMIVMTPFSGAVEAAGLHCTDAAKATWLPAAQIKQMLQAHGFGSVGAVKADAGNCYVVEVTDQNGAKKVLYLDPTDGALMGME